MSENSKQVHIGVSRWDSKALTYQLGDESLCGLELTSKHFRRYFPDVIRDKDKMCKECVLLYVLNDCKGSL